MRINVVLLRALACLLAMLPSVALGQTAESRLRHHVSLTGALIVDDTWQLEAGYHYMVCPLVGVGGQVGMWRQFASGGVPAGSGWRIDDDDERAMNFYVQPSVVVQSPALVKTSGFGLRLFAEPGFMLNIPYGGASILKFDSGSRYVEDYDHVSCSDGRWWAFSLKVGLSVSIEQMDFSLGYLFSTLDVYGMRRNMKYGGVRFDDFYPARENVHGAFIRASYNF